MTFNYRVTYKDDAIETGLVEAVSLKHATSKVQKTIWPREWETIEINRKDA